MKTNRSISYALLSRFGLSLGLSLGLLVMTACSFFKSDYKSISAEELKVIIEDLPDSQKRVLAQSEQARKALIDQFKKACQLAQAAEDEGLDKSDDFKQRTALDEERLLAAEFSKRNLDFNVGYDELKKYLDENKAAFDTAYPVISGDKDNKATPEEKQQVGLMWADSRIRGVKGREAGLVKDQQVISKLKFRRANLLADLYAGLLGERNRLSPEEKASYIAANPSADIDKLRARAQSLLDRVKGGESFETIANENNDDGTRGSGGDLSWVAKGMMDSDFEKAAFALKKGEVSSELVRSQFGFHIIRVDDRRPAKPAPNDPAKSPASAPAPGAPTPASAEPEEEIRARHIFVITQDADTFEQRLIDEKVKRAIEDATIKYEVAIPLDFTVQVPGFNPNSSRSRPGGGNSGSMRGGSALDNR